MDKRALFDAFRDVLQGRLHDLQREQAQATSGTRIDAERPANRGERGAVSGQGYLSMGLGQRAAALVDALNLLDRVPATPRAQVTVGALVGLEDADGERTVLLVLPGGEGTELAERGQRVVVVSPDAPVVRALWGRVQGDAASVRRGERLIEVEIVEVA